MRCHPCPTTCIRSRANGFVKIAVSLTIAVSAVISLLVVDRSVKLAFAIPAALMLVAFFTAGVLLHRRRTPPAVSEPAPTTPPSTNPPSSVP